MTPALRQLALNTTERISLIVDGRMRVMLVRTPEQVARDEKWKAYYKAKNAERRRRNLELGLRADGTPRKETTP